MEQPVAREPGQAPAGQEWGGFRAYALMTEEEAARFLALAPKTLACWRVQRKGPPLIWVGGRLVRYRLVDLMAWAEGQRVVPEEREVPTAKPDDLDINDLAETLALRVPRGRPRKQGGENGVPDAG